MPHAAVVEKFLVERALPQGTLIIQPARQADVGAASVLLTRAFAASPQGVAIADGRKYCEECLRQPPDGVLLVGRLRPAGASRESSPCEAVLALNRPNSALSTIPHSCRRRRPLDAASRPGHAAGGHRQPVLHPLHA